MPMTLAERLVLAREESGYPDTKPAADKARITPSALYQLENGKTKSLHGPTAVQLSRVYPRFRIEWLIAGEGPRYVDGYSPAASAPSSVRDGDPVAFAAAEIRPGYVRLPLLNMEGDMGHGFMSEDPLEVVQHLDVAAWWAQQNLPGKHERVRVISARGDSMAGVINHGDIVFVDPTTNYFDGEGIYVFNWQGRALIKRLAPNLRSGQLQILSANSAAYPPEEVPTNEIDQLHIAGRVLAWWTLRKY